ncbi:hypothetical protein FHW15_003430, partial [Terracoccus luteus]|nr:hypothetical protein [Terracoccus luteus]
GAASIELRAPGLLDLYRVGWARRAGALIVHAWPPPPPPPPPPPTPPPPPPPPPPPLRTGVSAL